MSKFIILFCFIAVKINAQTVRFDTLVTGFTNPVAIIYDPLGNLYIAENKGRIYYVDQNKSSFIFLDITSLTNNGYSGIHGVAFDPNYAINGYLYIKYYNDNTKAVHITRFSRNTTNVFKADLSSEFNILSYPNQNGHLGGNIEFGLDGYLYFTTGDGASGGRTQVGDEYGYAQNLNNIEGKLMRINVANGTLAYPNSNPFLDINDGIANEIIGYGLRNPWKFSFDKLNGDLWLGDVGQNDFEEIDYVPFGNFENTNFGWSCFEGNMPLNSNLCYTGISYINPALVYEGYNYTGNSASVTGGYVYRGSRFSNLKGWYFFADFATNEFWKTKKTLSGNYDTQSLGHLVEKPVSFGQSPSGDILVASYSLGIIYKLNQICPQFADITGVLNNGQVINVTEDIKATAYIVPNFYTEFNAGKAILLNPGFETKNTFKAEIKTCN